ncbi:MULTISPECIES: hypothetical protein [Actinotignum]|uniref:Uncharacterized protein n=2 Tax=Actinotignum timonense TaxID=1870995 RepID=A0ABU5GBH9_9ACTO|nr:MULTISPECIES: hypothetical protein [Actinotignum]MDE1537167.1 hypothetical protein [Actinotignum schaalii]MDE1558324.1 hypothetical protein [Actinotignum schaalii]MDE1664003.1 hypothetical protein [Actinotignum schaalii]MDK6372923.1 hypothetical protein [Actinotignum timonense]MDK8283769.1 hypothetical protein [Actinotignum timonense]
MSASFSFTAGFATGATQSPLQRRIRKMSDYPRQERVFSIAKRAVPIGGVFLAIGILGILGTLIVSSGSNLGDFIPELVGFSASLILGLLLVWVGLARRYGVNQVGVWSHLTPFFHHDIPYSQITSITTAGNDGWKVYGNSTHLTLSKDVFDYTLAYLRILEELKHRRFTANNVEPHDPRWPEAAQNLRYELAAETYRNHRGYYDSRPAEFQALIELSEGR